MSLSAFEQVVLVLGISGFGGAVGWLGFAMYIAYTKMESILMHLQRSPGIKARQFLAKAGPWGRLHLLGIIMGFMVMPRIQTACGEANAEDLENFPPDLRRTLIFLHWSGWPFLIIIIGLGIGRLWV